MGVCLNCQSIGALCSVSGLISAQNRTTIEMLVPVRVCLPPDAFLSGVKIKQLTFLPPCKVNFHVHKSASVSENLSTSTQHQLRIS